MAKPTSKVTICNFALGFLNAGTVSDIDSPSTKAESVCARWYDQIRREVLRKHTWKFASKRALLPKSANTPLFEFGSLYPLPADYIRLISIGKFGDVGANHYRLEDNNILVGVDSEGAVENDSSLPIRYVYDFEAVGLMDPLFIKLLALELAAAMAIDITGKLSALENVLKIVELLAPEGYSIDGQEQPPVKIEKSRYLGARRGDSTVSRSIEDVGYVVFDE